MNPVKPRTCYDSTRVPFSQFLALRDWGRHLKRGPCAWPTFRQFIYNITYPSQ
eukprot:jgi/Botrbrau1/23293/Bobra.0102s0034.1